MAARPVVAIMGPTATGKTAIAMALVDRFGADIISVDSAMVNRGMDIGTAKPSDAELARAPHRLIDVCDPSESYSAGRFRRDALAEIADIHAHGRLPVLAGGTMLYFRALFRGLSALPNADEAVRARLDEEAAEIGWPRMHERLAAVDPEAGARIHPNDAQRIQRALEVYECTGEPISAWQSEGSTTPLSLPALRVALVPEDRGWLHERIEQRLSQMMEEGFLDEVRALRDAGAIRPDSSAGRAVGYRQLLAYLDGVCTLEDAVAATATATRRLAKRQLTWLRSENEPLLIDPSEPGAKRKTIAAIDSWLANLN